MADSAVRTACVADTTSKVLGASECVTSVSRVNAQDPHDPCGAHDLRGTDLSARQRESIRRHRLALVVRRPSHSHSCSHSLSTLHQCARYLLRCTRPNHSVVPIDRCLQRLVPIQQIAIEHWLLWR